MCRVRYHVSLTHMMMLHECQQVENEYGAVQATYREDGAKYIQWAADMAVGLYGQIPWLMCKQPNAPSSVVLTYLQSPSVESPIKHA